MKVNQKQLASFISHLTQQHAPAKLTSQKLARELAKYIETHPSVIDRYGTRKQQRFSYSTVGYGIFSLLGEKYRMGRIEVFDNESGSAYQIHEGTYCLPHQAANAFEDFMDSFNTELPIHINLGSRKWCDEECVKALGLNCVEDLQDTTIIAKFRQQSQEAYAQGKGYKDWEDYLAKEPLNKPEEPEAQ